MMDNDQIIEEIINKVKEVRDLAKITGVLSTSAMIKVLSLTDQIIGTLRNPISTISPLDLANFLNTVMTDVLKEIDWAFYEMAFADESRGMTEEDLCISIMSDIYYPVNDQHNFRALIPDFKQFSDIFMPIVKTYVQLNLKKKEGEG